MFPNETVKGYEESQFLETWEKVSHALNPSCFCNMRNKRHIQILGMPVLRFSGRHAVVHEYTETSKVQDSQKARDTIHREWENC